MSIAAQPCVTPAAAAAPAVGRVMAAMKTHDWKMQDRKITEIHGNLIPGSSYWSSSSVPRFSSLAVFRRPRYVSEALVTLTVAGRHLGARQSAAPSSATTDLGVDVGAP